MDAINVNFESFDYENIERKRSRICEMRWNEFDREHNIVYPHFSWFQDNPRSVPA